MCVCVSSLEVVFGARVCVVWVCCVGGVVVDVVVGMSMVHGAGDEVGAHPGDIATPSHALVLPDPLPSYSCQLANWEVVCLSDSRESLMMARLKSARYDRKQESHQTRLTLIALTSCLFNSLNSTMSRRLLHLLQQRGQCRKEEGREYSRGVGNCSFVRGLLSTISVRMCAQHSGTCLVSSSSLKYSLSI